MKEGRQARYGHKGIFSQFQKEVERSFFVMTARECLDSTGHWHYW